MDEQRWRRELRELLHESVRDVPPTRLELRPRRRWPRPPSGRAVLAAGLTAVVVVVGGRLVLHRIDPSTPETAAAQGYGTALPLPTSARSSDAGATAEASGVLTVDGRGCLDLSGARLVWPAGWSAAEAPDGLVTIVDAKGAVVAHGGDRVEVGGAGSSLDQLQRSGYAVADPAGEPCLAGPVSSVFSVQSGVDVIGSDGAIGPQGQAF